MQWVGQPNHRRFIYPCNLYMLRPWSNYRRKPILRITAFLGKQLEQLDAMVQSTLKASSHVVVSDTLACCWATPQSVTLWVVLTGFIFTFFPEYTWWYTTSELYRPSRTYSSWGMHFKWHIWYFHTAVRASPITQLHAHTLWSLLWWPLNSTCVMNYHV